MIDGVLHFDFPSGPAAPVGVAAQPLIVGPENQLAAPALSRLRDATAASEIASQFNPLVVVGPEGSGKSHIAQGLIRSWGAKVGLDRVAYLTAADFGRDVQAAHGDRRVGQWRHGVHRLRFLAIEDVDRLRPRSSIQREIRQALDAIIGADGFVLVTALREPTALRQLDPGLRDRLVAGLTVRLNRPSALTRRAILAHAAAARGLSFDAEQLNRLAQPECDAPAQLFGRLAALCRGTEPLAVDESQHSLQPDPHARGRTRSRKPRSGRRDDGALMKQIVAVTARYFNVTQTALAGHSRRTTLVHARNVAVHLARRLTGLSYADIGRALGRRDHTTIMHASRRLAEQHAVDAATQQAVEELARLLE